MVPRGAAWAREERARVLWSSAGVLRGKEAGVKHRERGADHVVMEVVVHKEDDVQGIGQERLAQVAS